MPKNTNNPRYKEILSLYLGLFFIHSKIIIEYLNIINNYTGGSCV